MSFNVTVHLHFKSYVYEYTHVNISSGENYQDAEDLLNAVLVLEQNAGTHMHSTQYSPTMDLEENQGSDFILPDTILSSSDPYTSSDSLSTSILTSGEIF